MANDRITGAPVLLPAVARGLGLTLVGGSATPPRVSVLSRARRALDYLETPAMVRARRAGVRVDFVAELLDLDRRFGVAPATLLDVGANRGEYSRAAQFLYPGAQLVLFEPIPGLAARLRETWEPQGARVHAVALERSEGEREFYFTAADDLSSLLPPTETLGELVGSAEHTAAEPIAVRTARLDEIEDLAALPRPVLLKMDVQGAELDVLRGATSGLDAVDCIKLEYNFEPMYEGQVRLPELVAFLDDHGFRRFVQVDLRLEYPTIHCCDFVFLRDPG